MIDVRRQFPAECNHPMLEWVGELGELHILHPGSVLAAET